MHTSSICTFYNHLPVLSEPAVISVLVDSEGTHIKTHEDAAYMSIRVTSDLLVTKLMLLVEHV